MVSGALPNCLYFFSLYLANYGSEAKLFFGGNLLTTVDKYVFQPILQGFIGSKAVIDFTPSKNSLCFFIKMHFLVQTFHFIILFRSFNGLQRCTVKATMRI